jgi:hypothetical protein
MVGAQQMMPAVRGGAGLPMIPPTGMAIAALTVMLWLIWSDTIRTSRTPGVLYALRVALFVIVAGILVLNRIRYPFYFSSTATVLVVIVALVGAGGAAYFARKLVRGGKSRAQ